MVIPMKTQYEQHCNAAALKLLDVHIIKSLKKKHHSKIGDWLNNKMSVEVEYPDNAGQIIETILENHSVKNEIRKAANKETLVIGSQEYKAAS